MYYSIANCMISLILHSFLQAFSIPPDLIKRHSRTERRKLHIVPTVYTERIVHIYICLFKTDAKHIFKLCYVWLPIIILDQMLAKPAEILS